MFPSPVRRNLTSSWYDIKIVCIPGTLTYLHQIQLGPHPASGVCRLHRTTCRVPQPCWSWSLHTGHCHQCSTRVHHPHNHCSAPPYSHHGRCAHGCYTCIHLSHPHWPQHLDRRQITLFCPIIINNIQIPTTYVPIKVICLRSSWHWLDPRTFPLFCWCQVTVNIFYEYNIFQSQYIFLVRRRKHVNIL